MSCARCASGVRNRATAGSGFLIKSLPYENSHLATRPCCRARRWLVCYGCSAVPKLSASTADADRRRAICGWASVVAGLSRFRTHAGL
jgi:hypothetical protein